MTLNRKTVTTLAASVLGVGLIAFIVVRGALAGSSSGVDDPTALVPEKELKEARPPRAAGSPAASEPGTDLLDLVQVKSDAIAGTWGFQDRALITSGTSYGRLQLACVPPAEYDLSLRVTRKRGVSSFHIGFIQDGRAGMIVVDGDDGQITWLNLADRMDPDNETRSIGKILKWNRECRLVLSVRKDSIAMTVDGKPLIDWKGPAARLAFPAGWNVVNPKALFLGSWDSVFRIEDVRLIPVTGTPTLLR